MSEITLEPGCRKHEILSFLADSSSNTKSQKQIADFLGLKSQSGISEHLGWLEDKGLIEVQEREGLADVKELTRQGFQVLRETPGQKRPMGGDSEADQGDVFLHKFFLAFEISNPEDLEDGWRERWVQGLPVRKRYLPDSGSYTYFRDDWKFRVTSSRVFVHLEEIRGQDAAHLKNKALVEAFEAVRWLEDQAPVECCREPVETEIWTNQAEMGKIAHPFGMLVDRYSDVSLEDVKVYDSQGQERYKFDKSHGPAEIECVDRENHEMDIEAEVSRLRDQAENPSKHRRIYEELPEEVDELKSDRDRLQEKVDELTDLVGRLAENQSEVQAEVKRNRENIDSVRKGISEASKRPEKQEAGGVISASPTQRGELKGETTDFSERSRKTVRLGRCHVCGDLGNISRDGHVETLECETCDKEFFRVRGS